MTESREALLRALELESCQPCPYFKSPGSEKSEDEMGRPRTSTNPRAEYWRKRYEPTNEPPCKETAEQIEEKLQQVARKPPERSAVTWLELSSGRSNS